MLTFDDSLPNAVNAVADCLPTSSAEDFRFIRDMVGQLHLIVPDETSQEALDRLNKALVSQLGPFAAPGGQPARRKSETLAGSALYDEPFLVSWVGEFAARIVERRAMGQDWVLQPTPTEATHPPRCVFFSLKGGVGRSTALSLWAYHLCQQGKTVMVIDLDLEAPGLGAQLLHANQKPRYGVVDWLVQDLVDDQANTMVHQMVQPSPLADAGLWVVPAFGEQTEAFPDNVMAKLARAYLEKDDADGPCSFALRLRSLVEALEVHVKPDVVLVDSRAGLHETAAGTLLHLDAEVLCFAVDLPVTWQGYYYLFGHLRQLAQSARAQSAEAGDWRERIKMVNARASGFGENQYINNAFALWTDTLYDTEEAGDSALSFDANDSSAPHYPLTIHRSDDFERFDPMNDLKSITNQQLNAVFGAFFDGLDDRLELINDD